MKKKHLGILFAFILHNSHFILASDWPQLQRDARHSGYTPDTPYLASLEPVPVPAWAGGHAWKALDPAWTWVAYDSGERLHRRTQPVVSAGRVFIGSSQGILHCLALASGKELWQATLDGPIVHSAAVSGSLVYAVTANGFIHALNVETGARAWTTGPIASGFSGAPVLADDALFIASRRGVCRRISQADGAVEWAYDSGGPVFQTVACNNGRVFFANENIEAHAVASDTGKRVWISQLAGATVREYYPVVTRGKVIFSTEPATGIPSAGTAPELYPVYADLAKQLWDYCAQNPGLGGLWHYMDGTEWTPFPNVNNIKDLRHCSEVRTAMTPEQVGEMAAGVTAALPGQQDIITRWHAEHPEYEVMHFLDEATGANDINSGVLFCSCNMGPMPPPATDADGYAYLPMYPAAPYTNPGGAGPEYFRLDPASGRFVEAITFACEFGRMVVDEIAGFSFAGDWILNGDSGHNGRGGCLVNHRTRELRRGTDFPRNRLFVIDIQSVVVPPVAADGWCIYTYNGYIVEAYGPGGK